MSVVPRGRAGAVIHRRIMIINDERRTAHLTVYAAAAQITGGMFIGEAGHARNELTGWITVRHPAVTLGPGKSALDLVTIRVPPRATRGEHYAVIWAQQAEIEPARPHANIRVVARVGIRVYLAVGRGGVPPTKFTITSVTGRESARGRPMAIARVRNTGGRAVDLDHHGDAGVGRRHDRWPVRHRRDRDGPALAGAPPVHRHRVSHATE